MNKIRVIIAILLCSFASAAIADEEVLVQERMVSIRAEGKQLDGLVIGAQARLDFIYVDAALVEALRTPSGFPDWLRWHAKDFASEELKGGALFVLRIETYNPWTFDPTKISVADYALKDEDILTKPAYVPKGDLPSHFEGSLSFRVPGLKLKPGQEIIISYGEDKATFRVPKGR